MRNRSRIHEHSNLIVTGFLFGLMTAVLEIVVVGLKSFLKLPFYLASWDMLWMTPLADVVLFGAVGLVFHITNRTGAHSEWNKAAYFVFSFLMFLSLTFRTHLVGTYTAVSLCILFALGLAMLAGKYDSVLRKLISLTLGNTLRHALVRVMLIIVLLAAGVRASTSFNEYREIAELPAVRISRPNVLLIILDTVRARNMSLYGYSELTTPRLDQFAKNGTVFDRAIAASTWSLPSHASMFTGHYPHELSAGWKTPLDESYPTLAEVLRSQGYLTAAFVANLGYVSASSGLNRGFVRYDDFYVSPKSILFSSSLGYRVLTNRSITGLFIKDPIIRRKKAEDVNEEFLQWLPEHPERPFFAFLNYIDAHAPYRTTDVSAKNTMETIDHFQKHSTKEARSFMTLYNQAISYLDDQLWKLISELNQRNMLKNTLVIVTSDHGEEFAEHGVVTHGLSLYMPALHVPLIMFYPGTVPANLRVSKPVSLVDLPETILDIIGNNREEPFPGQSLAYFWKKPDSINAEGPVLSELGPGSTNLPKWLPAAKGEMKSLVWDRYHFIKNGDGTVELYDYQSDPDEQINLATTKEGKRLVHQSHDALQSIDEPL